MCSIALASHQSNLTNRCKELRELKRERHQAEQDGDDDTAKDIESDMKHVQDDIDRTTALINAAKPLLLACNKLISDQWSYLVMTTLVFECCTMTVLANCPPPTCWCWAFKLLLSKDKKNASKNSANSDRIQPNWDLVSSQMWVNCCSTL
jgi:hypothetical protein